MKVTDYSYVSGEVTDKQDRIRSNECGHQARDNSNSNDYNCSSNSNSWNRKQSNSN